MIVHSVVLFHLQRRSQLLLSKIVTNNCFVVSSRCFSEKEQTDNNKNVHNNSKRYATSVAIAATLFGIYYYHNSINVFAKSKDEHIQCGELRNDLKTYTLEEVGQHDSKEKHIWVTFRRGVYDVTEFIDKHPGGPSKILMAAGASIEPFWSIFANHNTNEIYTLLESMRIGNISEEDSKSIKSNLDDPYAGEPTRHKALKVNGHKPFCAEPPASMLVESFITPTELFYVRNHLPVPDIDLEDYVLELAVEDNTKKTLDIEAIKKYPKCTITSAIMCGGNRRSEMAEAKPLKGLSWGVGAVGNATWTGARLCDVLMDMGIQEEDYKHVQFEGYDLDPSGIPYGASIPISRALNPRADVILAYEMNGRPIPRDHGFPVRVIVPGIVGARNVKWLNRIVLSQEESQSQFQQRDYKGFSPSTDWDNVDFSKAPAIQELPVISAICVPSQSEKVPVKDGKINVKGYAWSGGGRKIIRVDVTNDQGNTWHTANIVSEDTNAKEGRHWSWNLWSIDLPVDEKAKETEIWAKAVDSAYNVQPECFKNIWNLRGFLCNAYHRVKVTLDQ